MKLQRKTVRQRFFDFYSIVDLYLKCGGFRDIGYITYAVFVPHRIETRIREAYENIVNDFYEEIYDALVISIKSELRHYPGCTFEEKAYELETEYGLDENRIKKVKSNPGEYSGKAHILFTIPIWKPEFGGHVWARGTKLLIESGTVKTIQEKVYWIDQVLDLYHNNGHMINKSKFKCLSRENIKIYNDYGNDYFTTPLYLRANAKNILDFLPYNSHEIKRLVIPRKNILTATI
jgi:hypothetical protein